MGYTHYWSVNEEAYNALDAEVLDSMFIEIGSVITRVCAELDIDIEIETKTHSSRSTVPRLTSICFNGVGDASYEPFSFPPNWEYARRKATSGHSLHRVGWAWVFCKTAMKPYDLAVTAALTVIKDWLQDGVEVTSNGGPADWEKGVLLARLVTGRDLPFPVEGGEDV